MQLSQLIQHFNESVDSGLFHAMEVSQLLEALHDGAFLLGVGKGSDAEQRISKGKLFYLSMAHSAQARYARGRSGGVQVEFNTDYLRQRYKVHPVNYWHPLWDKTKPTPDLEQEDRLVSDKPTLPIPKPASKLIRCIHLDFREPEFYQTRTGAKKERDLVITANRLGIPVKFYTDPSRVGVPGGDVPLSQVAGILKLLPDKPPSKWRSSYSEADNLVRYTELLTKNHLWELSPKAYKFMRSNCIGGWFSDGIAMVDAAIHNSRSGDRKALHKFVLIMKRFGITSAKSYMVAMRDKWNLIYDKEIEEKIAREDKQGIQ